MRKVTSLLMAVTLLISCVSTSVFAESLQDNSAEIDALLEQRAELISLEMYDDVNNIDQQLAALGVEKLTPKQVANQFMNNNEVTPYVLTPSANNVTWLSNRTTYSYGGKTYEIQTLTAQPNQKNSNLKEMGDVALSSSYRWKIGLMNMLETAASGAAGSIPGSSFALTVYDSVKSFLTGVSKTTEIQSANVVYSYTHVTTATFKYVKIKGQSDTYQKLSYISTKGTTSVGYQYKEFKFSGGTAQPGIVQGNRTINSTPSGYNSNLNAVKSYTGSSSSNRAYVNSVRLSGIESKSIAKIYPVCPQYPAHVY